MITCHRGWTSLCCAWMSICMVGHAPRLLPPPLTPHLADMGTLLFHPLSMPASDCCAIAHGSRIPTRSAAIVPSGAGERARLSTPSFGVTAHRSSLLVACKAVACFLHDIFP